MISILPCALIILNIPVHIGTKIDMWTAVVGRDVLLYDEVMLDTLFHPHSIAVVGASSDPGKVGYAVLNNLIRFGFQGELLPVNPKGGEILGRKTYANISEAGTPDLAVICIPAAGVPGAVLECVRQKIRSAVIISAGFKESGPAGLQLEEQLRAIVRHGEIRLLGPNCLGVINTAVSMNATFSAGMLPAGRTAFFSQSGALGIAILDWAIGNRIGFSKFISLGNKADLNEADFIEYFFDDPETDLILGYIEDVVQGRRFLDVARKTTKVKPVILVKSGGTEAGARAASSHTGALAGSDNAFNAAFRQTGIVRAEGIEDLFEAALAFASRKIPGGGNLLIVTNAGGPGIIAADTAEKLRVNLPQLSRETLDRLRPFLPKNASLYNPVDIIGDASADRYATVLDEAIQDPNIDGILVILTPQAMVDVEGTAQVVVKTARKTDRPVLTSFMGEERVRTSVEKLKASGVPNFPYPEPAVKAFRRLVDHGNWMRKTEEPMQDCVVDRQAVERILCAAQGRGITQFAEDGSREILSAYGFRFPAKELASSSAEAAAVAQRIGFPVVLKIASPDILHKTDIGGVRLNINSPDEAAEAFSEITLNARKFVPSAFILGVTVYETVQKGREVILGITFDRTFGHMIMFGLGGIYVEVFRDVSFRIVPVSRADAHAMIGETVSYKLLQGVRGEAAADIDAIADGITRLSQLAADFPVIEELDINPLVVHGSGAVALDARIIIGSGKKEVAP